MTPTADTLARRRFVEFTAETIKNASNTEYPGVYPGEDHSWSPERFREQLRVEFHASSPLDSSFSLVGVDASVANAFRRIMVADVPTVAIENVFFNDNTSVVQDEVLAHRLGLVPLTGRPEGFRWMEYYLRPREDGTGGSKLTDYNTLVMQLDVKCEWHEQGKERFRRGERDPAQLYINSNGKGIVVSLLADCVSVCQADQVPLQRAAEGPLWRGPGRGPVDEPRHPAGQAAAGPGHQRDAALPQEQRRRPRQVLARGDGLVPPAAGDPHPVADFGRRRTQVRALLPARGR
jgi:hypothetical protein